MALFNFGKKMKESETKCACNASVEETPVESSDCCCGSGNNGAESSDCDCTDIGNTLSNIKILGSGCKSCHALYENVQEAVKNAGFDAKVEYITDLEKVMTYGVMSMPGLVVNETVVSVGKVLKPADVEKLLHKLGL